MAEPQRTTEISEEEFERGRGSLGRRALTRLRRLVQDNRSTMAEIREAGRFNEHFYSPLGDQWPADVSKLYRQLNIPAKGINETWPVVHAVTGQESTSRFKPKFQGEDPDDQGLADAFNTAMQRARRAGSFESVTSSVFRQACVQRLGLARFTADVWGSRKAKFHMKRVRLDQSMCDFWSEQPNLMDMSGIAHGRWMSLDEFMDFYASPDASEIYDAMSSGGAGYIAEFDGGGYSDAWSVTTGIHDGITTNSIPFRRSTKEIFVVELEWKERTPRFEVELPGEVFALWQQQAGVGLPEDEDLDDDLASAGALGSLAAQALAQNQQQLQAFQQQVAQLQAAGGLAEGQQPPEPPSFLPEISRQMSNAALMAFQTGFTGVAGRPHSRTWELQVAQIYQATIVGDYVLRATRRPDNFWSMIPLIPFQTDHREGVRPYSLVDILKPRQIWLNMFISVWMHAMAHMPKAQFGLDLDRMEPSDVSRINSRIAKGDRALGVPGGKDAIFPLPGGNMPEGVERAMQMFMHLVPGAAGQEGQLPITGDLRRTASALVTHQLELSNKILAEAFDSLRQFRRMEALKIAHMICAYWTPEEFRRAAGKYAKHIPDDRSAWWKFLEFDLVVTEEPATRDTATAVVEALNQTAMWQAIWQINPEGIAEMMAPLWGSRMTETTLAKLQQQEPGQLIARLSELTGADPAALQAAIQGGPQGAPQNA